MNPARPDSTLANTRHFLAGKKNKKGSGNVRSDVRHIFQSKFDYSLFNKKKSGNEIVVLLIYFDNLVISGNSVVLIDQLKVVLKDSFKMKDLGKLKYFFGY